MNIYEELTKWDGKSADDMAAIYQRQSHSPCFEQDLINLITDTACQKAVTWLLKRHLELGHQLDANQIRAIFESLKELQDWESKLHVLQFIEHTPIESAEKNNVEAFLRQCLADTNNFVRAWAYNGFHLLSQQYPEYKAETLKFFEMAMKDETAAVKARVRNIMKTIS